MAKCALVGPSEPNMNRFNEQNTKEPYEFVVAVDGGYSPLQKIDRTPDVAIGDFDSLGYVPAGCVVIQFPSEKNSSDTELALHHVERRGYKEVDIYGVLGGRMDHTFANLQLLAAFTDRGMRIVLYGDVYAVTAVSGPGEIILPPKECGRVSVFALGGECEGVYERGLKYKLEGEPLSNRTTRGLSNEFDGEEATIGLEKGMLLIFYSCAD